MELTSAVSPAHNGDTALVPPTTVSWPLTRIRYPVSRPALHSWRMMTGPPRTGSLKAADWRNAPQMVGRNG